MAKNIETPADVEIASMRKEHVRRANLMEPGPGTPWEDRGSVGFVPAYFKTAFMAMFKPGTLLHAIRRPETPGDARAFTLVCGFFWGLAWVINDLVQMVRKQEEFDVTIHGYGMAIHFALAMAGTWFLLNLSTRLFHRLVTAGSKQQKFQPSLAYNVFAYCLGPSLVAVIPFHIGPAIAVAWIIGLFIYGAASRMAVSPANAVVCVIISIAGFLLAAVGAYFLSLWVLDKLDILPSAEPTGGPTRRIEMR